ncbi:MAG TPA: hypothetical protein VMV19_17525 [Xanthobacteraceae bacterium]|nr:hypothetical protein [Xanthobacteraceae bacterium]
MASLVPFNPLPTVNAPGSFNVSSDGFIQGCAIDDPVARFRLRGGYLSSTATTPLWGGCGISEIIPGGTGTPNSVLGPGITLATSVGAATSGQQAAGILTGFSVFDQNLAAIMTPQSPVPLVASGMQVNYYPLGSNARIPVAIDPVLADLESYLTRSLVSWDFTGQRLIPYVPAYLANVFTALTRALTGGVYVATATTTSAHGIAVGDDFAVSGCAPAAYNGTWTAITGTTGSTLVWSLGTAVDPGAETTLGQLNAGGGALGPAVIGGAILPVQVIDVQIGNSMTVAYSAVTGFYTWNRAGSVAIIQI